MASEKYYVLPSSPEIKCEDRFSLLDTDELEVPFWQLLEAVLKEPVTTSGQIIEILDTIAVTLRESNIADYGRLRDALNRFPDITNAWPRLVEIALSMAKLFPEHRLPILGRGQSTLSLTREQTCCLVLHQFLCTLRPPSWQDGYQDFDLWYAREQPHDNAADIYLDSLLTYFLRCASAPSLFDEANRIVKYTMRSSDELQSGLDKLLPLEVIRVPQVSTRKDLIGLGRNACVVSANKFVGFGQSATQEEIFVGTSPESCPIVLVTPPLRDEQVLTVQGAEAMIETVGQRRSFRAVGPYRDEIATCDEWRTRTMLFMDALELDLAAETGCLPDLVLANMCRERRKAQTAFGSSAFESVSVGFWGCGAFNGDAHVKMLLLWSAASAAGTRLRVICEGDEAYSTVDGKESFADQLQAAADIAVRKLGSVTKLEAIMLSDEARSLGKGQMLGFVHAQLHELPLIQRKTFH